MITYCHVTGIVGTRGREGRDRTLTELGRKRGSHGGRVNESHSGLRQRGPRGRRGVKYPNMAFAFGPFGAFGPLVSERGSADVSTR